MWDEDRRPGRTHERDASVQQDEGQNRRPFIFARRAMQRTWRNPERDAEDQLRDPAEHEQMDIRRLQCRDERQQINDEPEHQHESDDENRYEMNQRCLDVPAGQWWQAGSPRRTGLYRHAFTKR